MKITVAVWVCLLFGVSGSAQSRSSVWLHDYTGQEVQAAIAAGKTTLIYCSGATHADGPVIAVGKHIRVATEVARRIAEQVGNALVMPINPYAEAGLQMSLSGGSGGQVTSGTISLTPETAALVVKDVVNSTVQAVRQSEGLVGTGFKNVMIMGDHTQGQDTLERVAKELDRDWKPKGVRVYFIDLGPSGKKLMQDHLTKLNQDIPRDRMTPIDDAAELLSVDRNHEWVREDKLPPIDRKVVSVELGKILVDFKVNTAVQQIRKVTAEDK